MRKLVVASSVLLTLSGLGIWVMDAWLQWEDFSAVLLVHSWVGLFFIVIFPMYAWDHIGTNRARLKKLSWLSISGGLQAISGMGLILSGIVLLLYEINVLSFISWWHLILTGTLVLSLVIHYFCKKN